MIFTGDWWPAIWLYARPDVLFVYFLCCIPLAIYFAAKRGVQENRLPWVSLVYGVFLASFLVRNLLASSQVDSSAFSSQLIPQSFLMAHGLRIAVILPLVPILGVLIEKVNKPKSFSSSSTSLWKLICVAVLMIVPVGYVDSVAEGMQKRFEKYLKDSRVYEARQLGLKLVQLRPQVVIFNLPLSTLSTDLNDVCDRYAVELQSPLPLHSPTSQVGQRITLLVQMGRCDEALGLLRPLTQESDPNPIAWDFLGLCYQRLEQPEASLQAYQQAESIWLQLADTPGQPTGLANAYRGIGFAARQLGERYLEEEAYRSLLEVREHAESHFLLGQCYRDHQKTELATSHFRMALEMQSSYGPEVERIFQSMKSEHFGCFRLGAVAR